VIKTCTGTACHVNGANILHDTFCQLLKIAPGDHMDPTGEFTVEEVALPGVLHAGAGGADRRSDLRADLDLESAGLD
jgi:hypothetical protein